MEYSGEKLISLDKNGAHVLAESVSEKIAKKNISPSMVTSFEGCSARWLGDQFVVSALVEEQPDNAARRGSLFHSVMENLFALPPEERTKEAMKKAVTETLQSEDYVDISKNRDVVMWLRNAVNGYYTMGGDPTKVEIAEIERMKTKKDGTPYGVVESGIEIFVKGPLGEASRPTLGFIDQVIVDPTRDDGSVIIQDWKSGAKVKKYKPKNKSEDGLAEQRQQIIYSELLRQEGVKVSGARLIFPVAREVVDVDLGSTELRDRTIRDVEETDKKLDLFIENNTFEYKPSFICAWCPLARICPEADIKPYEKMREAYAKQPTPEVLMPGVELL